MGTGGAGLAEWIIECKGGTHGAGMWIMTSGLFLYTPLSKATFLLLLSRLGLDIFLRDTNR